MPRNMAAVELVGAYIGRRHILRTTLRDWFRMEEASGRLKTRDTGMPIGPPVPPCKGCKPPWPATRRKWRLGVGCVMACIGAKNASVTVSRPAASIVEEVE